MSTDLKCLRCGCSMQLGKIQHTEQLYPTVWSVGQSQEPEKNFRIVSHADASRIREVREQMLLSRTYVDAYRCTACGYIEFSATRKVQE